MDGREPESVASDDHAPLPPPSYASLVTPLAPGFPAFAGSARTNTPFDHSMQHLNMPSGYFLLRNKSTRQRAFDVRGRGTAEGNEICLHPVKQPYVARGDGGWRSLQNSYNNQVLYIDWSGHLMTASADGRAIDCVDGNLILAIPRPIFAIPSRDSHALPKFHFEPETSTLHVRFSYDPSFPGPDSTSTEWAEYDYLVESVPVRRMKDDPAAPSVWATASSGLLSGIGKLGLFARSAGQQAVSTSDYDDDDDAPPPPPVPKPVGPWDLSRSPSSQTISDLQAGPSRPPHDSTSASPLPYTPYHRAAGSNSPLAALPPRSPSTVASPPSPSASNTRIPSSFPSNSSLAEQDNDSDSDSDPDAYRPLRVVRLAPSWRDKFPRELLARPLPPVGIERSRAKELSKWRRRQWDVVPVVVKPIEPVGGVPILPLLPLTGLLSGNFSSVTNFPSVGAAIGGIGRTAEGAVGVGRSDERERRDRDRPRALNLQSSSGARARDEFVSPPLPHLPRAENGDVEAAQSSRSRTPITGDSWADATILPSAAIAGLALAPESDDDPQPPSTPPRTTHALPPSTLSKNSPRLPETPLPTLRVVSPQEHSLAALPPVPTTDPAGVPVAELPEVAVVADEMEAKQFSGESGAQTVVESGTEEGGQDGKALASA